MKNWKLILGVFLALLLLAVTPLAVMAAGNNDPKTRQAVKVQLTIIQPRVVEAGRVMQMTVLERLNQNVISEADIWSVNQENIQSVKGEIQSLISGGVDNVTNQDYVDILTSNGSELGYTDAAGKLTCTFNNAAKYWLVALKSGYRPGFSQMAVRQEISVSAVKKAPPGESVTITVNQKVSSDPVTGVSVWAVDSSMARALKNKLTQLKMTHEAELENIDWDIELNGLADYLGTTNIEGQVTHTFAEGKYLLVAVKNGCQPVFTKLNIVEPDPASATAYRGISE